MMYKYGQYCPIAKAVEILGDRWTLLIIRDLLTGACHFNEIERGLPGISRGLLASRLRRLERMGLVEKVHVENGRQRTAYFLTEAGQELKEVINSLLIWGARWAFEEPAEEDLDPVLLMWWMRSRVYVDHLPDERVVVQFCFTGARYDTFWLLLTKEDVSVCLTDPGFETNVLVTTPLSTFFQIWLGRIEYDDAQRDGLIEIDAIPALANAFPTWFAYSLAAPVVRQTAVSSTA